MEMLNFIQDLNVLVVIGMVGAIAVSGMMLGYLSPTKDISFLEKKKKKQSEYSNIHS